MTPALRSVYLQRVEDRLKASDAELELAQLQRMSPYELDLLVKMERGWGPVAA